MEQPKHNSGNPPSVYWRVEGSLLDLTVVAPLAFFTWNDQTFSGRVRRRGLIFLMAVLRPFLYASNRKFATRMVHTVLRGVTRDRLDLLGEEYFQYRLRPRLKAQGVQKVQELLNCGADVVLVSQGLDHVMRPLARHLGVKHLVANRLEFRDRVATGRLLEPVIRPRGVFARLREQHPDGRRAPKTLARHLGISIEELREAVIGADREALPRERPIVHFDGQKQPAGFSVARALRGKHLMLIGVTGFIGKVWLVNTLLELPEVGRIYLLVRRQKSNPAERRFEKIVEESPVFDPLFERSGDDLPRFLRDKVEVLEGDVTRSGLGLSPENLRRMQRDLDLVINSSGLTDFNPDLRDAITTNTDAALNIVEFVRTTDHAGLLHLSTCYVAGEQDGRVAEKLVANYTPRHIPDFDAEQELRNLHELIRQAEAQAEGTDVSEGLKMQALAKEHAAKDLQGAALENQIRKNRIRWLKAYLTELGTRRAKELGWPNTYTLTKSLAESLIVKYGAGLPIAVVRPAIVETSVAKPFCGWNEGINTSASLSYLLGTYFRQLPSNESKRLDIIPVDAVCDGMTLIAAAIIERRHDRLYQLATSVTNPCDMGRSIELTSLAHRKHYRAQEGLESWLRLRFDAIPVSKTRYNRMSAPAQRAIVKSIQRVMSPLPLKRAPLVKTERSLERLEKLIELFEPFILLNEHDFAADNIEKLSYALVPEEQKQFGYDTRDLDWWEYWINVHIPALRRWTYPLIEGRPLEARPARTFQLAPAAVENGETVKTGTNGATWRYS
ncbi:MAG TPA: SDR family oxidoreductase [Candidatus Sulfotelmatobacter sp.]|nr:SDR family oxidoreductase [Candidatus Sulfotelmatobacter sp.]